MTHISELLHLTVNRFCKVFLRKYAQDWYSNEIRKEMKKCTQAHEVKADVHISVLKPLHALWVTKFYEKMQNKTDIILNGWKQSGVTNAVSSESQKSEPSEV